MPLSNFVWSFDGVLFSFPVLLPRRIVAYNDLTDPSSPSPVPVPVALGCDGVSGRLTLPARDPPEQFSYEIIETITNPYQLKEFCLHCFQNISYGTQKMSFMLFKPLLAKNFATN